MAKRQVAFAFSQGPASSKTAAVRGGKGASLATMTDLGLPVPPGFTLTPSVCRAYVEHGRLPARVTGQLDREILSLEAVTGRQFGDPSNPLLVSVRSGAQNSMPGMMETLLNVGLHPLDLSGLAAFGGKRFALDTRRRFETQYRQLINLDLRSGRLEIPTSPFEQLYESIEAVFKSWNSSRARAYRKQHGIPNWIGTAVTVQAMVFGNIDGQSCTGVVFSADPATGEDGLYGEFLTRAQGEDVVSGKHTPRPIAEMRSWNPALYHELNEYVSRLASHYDDVVDVEFTVERGQLFILQCRIAKCSPLATATRAVRSVWSQRAKGPRAIELKRAAVQKLGPSDVAQLRQHSFDAEAANSTRPTGRGLAASPGAATGIVARSSERAQELAKAGVSVILVRPDTSPEDLPGMLAAKAIVTETGGATCHAAVVARALGLPAVVNVKWHELPEEGTAVSVDGTSGHVFAGTLPMGGASPKEASIFLKWYQKHANTPSIDFSLFAQRFSMNRLLFDFYLSQAIAAETAKTPLEQEAEQLRHDVHQKVAEVIATYLVLAVVRESRHFPDRVTAYRNIAEARKAYRFIQTQVPIEGLAEVNVNREILAHMGNMPLPQVTEIIRSAITVFACPDWDPHYGGAAWRAIAEALLRYLSGAWSSTLFVDHAFDLRHNGGFLFNKHSMVDASTDEDYLRTQLQHKRNTSSIFQLYSLLSLRSTPSADVNDLWMKFGAQPRGEV